MDRPHHLFPHIFSEQILSLTLRKPKHQTRMTKKSFFSTLSCAVLLFAQVVTGEDLLKPVEPVTQIMRDTAMPELGDSRVEKILSQYYINGLGGNEFWDDIESFQLEGTLALEGIDFVLNAFQKKPNLLKMLIQHPETDILIEMGYDGEVAWKQMPRTDAKPMGVQETRRFAQSSCFGSHLLYPFQEGKTIRYIDTAPLDGQICHQVQVTTAAGYKIDYYIDIRTFLEAKMVSVDTTTGFVSTLVYSDYSREVGLPIPLTVKSYENSEWVSTFTIDEIKLNPGLMPWMFHLPKQ